MRILPNAGRADLILCVGLPGLENEPTLAVEVSRGRSAYAPAADPGLQPHGPGDYAVTLQAEDLNGFGDVAVRVLVGGQVVFREVVGYVLSHTIRADMWTAHEDEQAAVGLQRIGALAAPPQP